MKMAILGSTGFVGKELLKKSIEQGHQIKVLVRNPHKLGEFAKMVEVIEGDYFDKAKITKAITGTEIVISTIGPSTKKPDDIGKYTNSMTNAMTNLVLAMENENIKKIILIGGAATPVTDNEVFNYRQKFIKFMLNLSAKYIISIKTSECAILAKSNLDWIILRPPAITKGSSTHNVMADEHNLYRLQIDVADLVEFLLEQTTSNIWLHKAPLVSSIKKI